MNTLAPCAQQLAQALLQQPLPRRWAHVQGVAARARSLAPVLGPDTDLLEAAAWVHDVGYAPDLAPPGRQTANRRQCTSALARPAVLRGVLSRPQP